MSFLDMHTHSTASDGTFSPSQLVDYGIKKGLSGIAITDHDTVYGIEEAIQQANIYKNFIVVPGIELSTNYNNEEVHILGYMIDYKNKYLLKRLQDLRNQRSIRAVKIIEKLRDLGLKIDFKDIYNIKNSGSVGRPHIAKILINKGYVQSIEEAFNKYLSKGSPAYVPRQKLTPVDAINIIKGIGGFSVVAHPGLIKSSDILNYLIKIGIDGIEVYHSEHTEEQSLIYMELAQKHNLIVTGGSDFHYPPNNNGYHGDLGSVKIPLQNIQALFK